MPYDGTPEIKERGDGKQLYVRKRVAGKQTSTYVGAYTNEGFFAKGGRIRGVPVTIGGSSYVPPLPNELEVKDRIREIA